MTPRICDDTLTDAEELGVHTVEVADKEKRVRSCDVKKEQVASGQIQNKAASVDHQQVHQLHRKDHPEKIIITESH